MSIFDKLKVIIPFTYIWFLRKSMGNPKTILDIGCGDGQLMEVLSQEKNWEMTGIDIFSRNVKKASQRSIYTKVIKGDSNRILKELLKRRQKFDLVFCSQVIEHISRKRGEELLALVDSLARHRVVIGTPRGFMHQPEVFLGDNPHQVHLSGWTEEDFRERGYKVHGVGFFPLWSEEGLVHRNKNRVFVPFYFVTSFLLSPLVYFIPAIAAGILCIKDIKR